MSDAITQVPDVDRRLGWVGWPRCDVVRIPIEAGCGIFTELIASGIGPVPIAYCGDTMAFAVRAGSATAGPVTFPVAADGVRPHGVVVQPGSVMLASTNSIWLVGPDHNADLPPAQTLILAIDRAYAINRRNASTSA